MSVTANIGQRTDRWANGEIATKSIFYSDTALLDIVPWLNKITGYKYRSELRIALKREDCLAEKEVIAE